jgi:hypothetical protein
MKTGKWEEPQGHMDCRIFDEFLNVDQSVPATDDQKTSSDRPSCKYGANDEDEEEEKREGMQLLPM